MVVMYIDTCKVSPSSDHKWYYLSSLNLLSSEPTQSDDLVNVIYFPYTKPFVMSSILFRLVKVIYFNDEALLI